MNRGWRQRLFGALTALAVCLLCWRCSWLQPVAKETHSSGDPNAGRLVQGVGLDAIGVGYVLARGDNDTRFGSTALVGALRRAAAAVTQRYPGGAPLRIGDLSYRHGGLHPRHGSHQNGRDADLVFYLTDLHGHSLRGRSSLKPNDLGVALPGNNKTMPGNDKTLSRRSAAAQREAIDGDTYLFDERRNWWLVRSLLLDTHVQVLWLFCSAAVKKRLLSYAAEVEPDPELLFRAAWVLHQPSYGNPHADHFHLRVACTAKERSLGCVDEAPFWPWLE